MSSAPHHKADELLELLWHLDENHALTLSALAEHDPEGEYRGFLSELQDGDIVRITGESIIFTTKGRKYARDIIRSHRLAEALLVDVLGKEPQDTETAACEFEHVVAPELVDSICILLGHPRKSPHGLPIPEGNCCSEAKDSIQTQLIPITKLNIGESARIASINTKEENRLFRLLAIGLTPGTHIKLQQKYPALVLEVNNEQIALDAEIGEEIKIWRPAEQT